MGEPKSRPPQAIDTRYHALDALRASMMLLGLVFHSIISYTVRNPAPWSYHDGARTPVADFFVHFTHSFRMPIFFVLAGFFAALLYERRGMAVFASNRAVRIFVPFIVGVFLLQPFVFSGASFANTALVRSTDAGFAAVGFLFRNGSIFLRNHTLHLWFLYYLLYFYAFALLVAALAPHLPDKWRAILLEFFGSIVSRPFLRLLILSVATIGLLLPVGGILPTSSSFVPDSQTIVCYGFFFLFGWTLFFKRDLISDFGEFAWVQTLVAVFIFLIGDSVASALAPRDEDILRSLMGGVVVWLMFFGLTGLFLRYLNRPSAAVRYAVDSSYWIYLIHLPFIFWIAGLLSRVALPGFVKFLIVFSLTTLICVATYDLFVRSTAIGALLNGRRYKRGLPPNDGIALAPGQA